MISQAGPAAASLRLSVIIPAYNEEALLGATLRDLHDALAKAGVEAAAYEVIVCDNASTDATAAIAAAAGARVVTEPHRQIARARNTGARAARGRWLVFLDADTRAPAELLNESLRLLESGTHCGGGALVSSARLPWSLRPVLWIWNLGSRLTGTACGAYIFCSAEGFRAIDGFSEAFYAGEELDLSRRLKRWGRARGQRFSVVAGHPIETSMRKVELYGRAEIFRMALRGLANPRRVLRERRFLDLWYDGRR